jgi:tRNA(His) 5'-end guanylyltransferase
MRVYEQSLDQVIVPGMYIVARLDGRSFTKLTKETCRFEAPFDERFRDLMILATKEAMSCGFRVVYGYTQSDEISLLFAPDDNTFGRKVRKINTTLAGNVSAAFSMALGHIATFDCRVVPLPNVDTVCDYFTWRQEDANRNALNGWAYWTLRKDGLSARKATSLLEKKTIADKNEILFAHGINYNDLPAWQKRGVGLTYETVMREGRNPLTGKTALAKRRVLQANTEIPYGDAYKGYIRALIEAAERKR